MPRFGAGTTVSRLRKCEVAKAVEGQALLRAQLERFGDVGLVHEAEMQHDLPEAGAHCLDFYPALRRRRGLLMKPHDQDHVALVQHQVVLHVVQ